MPLSVLIAPLLALAAQPDERPVMVIGHAWAPFISPMGEPFRARTKADDTLALWFNQADRDRNGMLTAEEMQVDAERFFSKLDGNHDGEIDPEELVAYEWEVAPEIQLNSRWRRTPGQPAGEQQQGSEIVRRGARNRADSEAREGYQLDGLQGAARYALLNIPEPVAGADADFNRAITLAEFRQAATYRFQLLDGKHRGQLTLDELKALVPAPPKAGRRKKPAKDAVDPRIGLPLPKDN